MVAVEYKYPNEVKKIVADANSYEVEPGIVPNSTTLWQLFGVVTDITDGGKKKMFSCTPSGTPNQQLIERINYVKTLNGTLLDISKIQIA